MFIIGGKEMRLDEIKERWKKSNLGNGEIEERIWDRVSKEYYKMDVPDFETDPFLKLINNEFSITHEMNSLDIGCGTGRYSFAMAKKISHSVGIDLSGKMIEYARQIEKKLSYKNTDFYWKDWARVDIDEIGFRKAFDIVFAHMTPAISDYGSFEKMIACSRKYCIMEKHSRRTDSILDEVFGSIGLEKGTQSDEALIYIFATLWNMGYSPKIQYRTQVHKSLKTREDMTAWSMDRAKLRKELTAGEEEKMMQVIDSHTISGMVEETMSSTIVSIYWEV
ncbi:MAG: class I SAM-dependent methyltransferase [Cellulosilyticum sp.]|nr:class I SAM-dependent methyltransferase [Cellulosilyticum sp.]